MPAFRLHPVSIRRSSSCLVDTEGLVNDFLSHHVTALSINDFDGESADGLVALVGDVDTEGVGRVDICCGTALDVLQTDVGGTVLWMFTSLRYITPQSASEQARNPTYPSPLLGLNVLLP